MGKGHLLTSLWKRKVFLCIAKCSVDECIIFATCGQLPEAFPRPSPMLTDAPSPGSGIINASALTLFGTRADVTTYNTRDRLKLTSTACRWWEKRNVALWSMCFRTCADVDLHTFVMPPAIAKYCTSAHRRQTKLLIDQWSYEVSSPPKSRSRNR